MNYWKIILATMVIFGTGVVTGGLLVRHAARLRPGHGSRMATAGRPSPSPAPSPGALKLEFLRRMQKELELTPEQHQRVDALLSESQERTRRLMEPIRPQLAEELRQVREQFREALSAPQRERFDELIRQQRQHPREQRHPQTNREHPSPEASPPDVSKPPAP